MRVLLDILLNKMASCFDFLVEVDNICDVTRLPCTCFVITQYTWNPLLRNLADMRGIIGGLVTLNYYSITGSKVRE